MAKSKKIKAIVTYIAGGKLTPDMYADDSNRRKLPKELVTDIKETQKALRAFEGNTAKVAYYLNRLMRPADADGTKVYQKMGYKTLVDMTADYFNISAGTCRTYSSVGEKWIVRDKLGIHSKVCTFITNEDGEPTGIERDFTVSQLQEFGAIPPRIALAMLECGLITYNSKCAYMRDAGQAVKAIMLSVKEGKFTESDYIKAISEIRELANTVSMAFGLGYDIKPTFALEMSAHNDCFTESGSFSDKGIEILKAGEFPKAITDDTDDTADSDDSNSNSNSNSTKKAETTQKGIDNIFDAIRAMQSTFITALRMARGNDDYIKMLNDAVADNFDTVLNAVDGDYSSLDGDTADDTDDTADTADDTADTDDYIPDDDLFTGDITDTADDTADTADDTAE